MPKRRRIHNIVWDVRVKISTPPELSAEQLEQHIRAQINLFAQNEHHQPVAQIEVARMTILSKNAIYFDDENGA